MNYLHNPSFHSPSLRVLSRLEWRLWEVAKVRLMARVRASQGVLGRIRVCFALVNLRVAGR